MVVRVLRCFTTQVVGEAAWTPEVLKQRQQASVGTLAQLWSL